VVSVFQWIREVREVLHADKPCDHGRRHVHMEDGVPRIRALDGLESHPGLAKVRPDRLAYHKQRGSVGGEYMVNMSQLR